MPTETTFKAKLVSFAVVFCVLIILPLHRCMSALLYLILVHETFISGRGHKQLVSVHILYYVLIDNLQGPISLICYVFFAISMLIILPLHTCIMCALLYLILAQS